jgi:hypothetical protein
MLAGADYQNIQRVPAAQGLHNRSHFYAFRPCSDNASNYRFRCGTPDFDHRHQLC